MTTVKELSIQDIETIKTLYFNVFTKEPWNFAWKYDEQLHTYITYLIGNPNSLTYGIYEEDCLVGLAMGHTIYWYIGVAYYIEEFCISPKKQHKGLGTIFIKEIEKKIVEKGIVQLFLQTEKSYYAYQFYIKNGFVESKGRVTLTKDMK